MALRISLEEERARQNQPEPAGAAGQAQAQNESIGEEGKAQSVKTENVQKPEVAGDQ